MVHPARAGGGSGRAHTLTTERPSPPRAALQRPLDHYLHTATLAMDAADPHDREQRPSVWTKRVHPGTHMPGLAKILAWVDRHRSPAPRGHHDDTGMLHQWALTVVRATSDHADALAARTSTSRACTPTTRKQRSRPSRPPHRWWTRTAG